jgi:outer membrane protein
MIRNVLIAAALCAGAAQAADGGYWQVGGRLIGVIPDESADITVVGGDVEIDDSYMPELDISYYFNPHWSIEVIASTMEHSVKHTPTNLDLGSVWLLPPTVTVSYHFMPDGGFQPYIGAGVNYTVFYSVDTDNADVADVDYDNAFGWALVAGFDIPVDDHWKINFDVKKIFLSTDATVTVSPGVVAEADVDIDPWVIGIGARYTFN